MIRNNQSLRLESASCERSLESRAASDSAWFESQDNHKFEIQLRLAQSLKALGTLAGGIAHAFNNIHSTILGYSQLVLDEMPEGSLAKANMLEVIRSTRRAQGLLRQLLMFSRDFEHETHSIDPAKIGQETLEMLEASMPAAIKLCEDFDIGDTRISMAPVRLLQVLVNICTNAIQAMKEKGGVLWMRMKTVDTVPWYLRGPAPAGEGEYLLISVSDTGCGMSQDTVEKIFDPFCSTKQKDQGLGLGLSVVYGIVADAGGFIDVDSIPGRGTIVRIYLPVCERAATAPESSVELLPVEGKEIFPLPGSTLLTGRPVPGAEGGRRQEDAPLPCGGRILFLDDMREIAELESQLLRQMGCNVTSFTDQLKALDAFRSDPDAFDLVITDYEMPGMKGNEFAAEVQRIRRNMPVIICTGLDFTEFSARDDRQDLLVYLEKPVDREALCRTINHLMQKHQDHGCSWEKKVLIIDDDRSLREMLGQAIEKEGYVAIEAANGLAGLNILREIGADLVITDILMPEKDGLEVLRELRSYFPDVEVFCISGGSSRVTMDFLNLSRKLGAAKVFPKPIDIRELLAALNGVLSQKSPQAS